MKATFLMAVPPAVVPPIAASAASAASAAVPPACTRDGGATGVPRIPSGGVPRIPSGGEGGGGDGAAAGVDAYRELLQSKVQSDAVTDAAPQLSSDELRQARLLFGEIDRDGNGVLDEVEFGEMLRRLKRNGRREY